MKFVMQIQSVGVLLGKKKRAEIVMRTLDNSETFVLFAPPDRADQFKLREILTIETCDSLPPSP